VILIGQCDIQDHCKPDGQIFNASSCGFLQSVNRGAEVTRLYPMLRKIPQCARSHWSQSLLRWFSTYY